MSYQKNLFKLSNKDWSKNKQLTWGLSEAKILAFICKTSVHGQYAVLTMYVPVYVPCIAWYLQVSLINGYLKVTKNNKTPHQDRIPIRIEVTCTVFPIIDHNHSPYNFDCIVQSLKPLCLGYWATYLFRAWVVDRVVEFTEIGI